MDKIENFLKEPSMEKLERLRKSEIVKIGEKLELNVQNTMRKHELVRKKAEQIVDENMFEDPALEELPTEIKRMTPEQIELEKIKIQAQMELQRNKMPVHICPRKNSERGLILQGIKCQSAPSSHVRK